MSRPVGSTRLGARAEGSDYAAVVDFLLADGGRFVRGQMIHANGGA